VFLTILTNGVFAMQAMFTRITPQGRAQRLWLCLLAVWCAGLLVFGLYLQHIVNLEPCPMCIVQRYALVVAMVLSVLGAWLAHRRGAWVWPLLLALIGCSGAFVAARQSWLQWFPPESFACGRDFYGMIEAFPLQKVIPMLFKGSGDCSSVDWTFLSLSIANWSFINFIGVGVVAVLVFTHRIRRG
jgi:disulfide bond formation protein DsbB